MDDVNWTGFRDEHRRTQSTCPDGAGVDDGPRGPRRRLHSAQHSHVGLLRL